MILPMPDDASFTTGGQVDAVALALIDAAFDKKEEVRVVISHSLHELGKKQPRLILGAAHSYLCKHPKLAQGHRMAILNVMERICRDCLDMINRQLAVELIEQASSEMTRSKDVLPDWQTAASGVLVAIGCKFSNEVMEELLKKFQPGVLPHFFIVQTLGNLAAANVYGVLPFLKAVLGTMLPMLGMAKHDNMRWVFSAALAKFSEAILEYIANIDKAPDPTVTGAVFISEIDCAYDVLFNVWLQSKEPKLRLAVVEALGHMAHLMEKEKLEEQLPKLISGIMKLYPKHQDSPFHITQGLAMVLDAATSNGSAVLETQVEGLLTLLFTQACQPPVYNNQGMLRNQNEVLRCFDILARIFSDRMLAGLLHRLESTSEKVRIGALRVFRHLINASGTQFIMKKASVISGLKIMLNENSNKVKKEFVQVIVALAHHDYLREEGGDLMIQFIVTQCSLPNDPPQVKRAPDADAVSGEALRKMCDNVLHLLVTTVDVMQPVLWPLLLQFVADDDHADALATVCRGAAHLAARKREENAEDYEISYVRHTNIPKPHELLARLLVLTAHPKAGRGRGAHVLKLMKAMSPNINKSIVALWDTVIPKLIQYLEAAEDKEEEDWSQKSWEDLILKLLSKTLDEVDSEDWTSELGATLVKQIPLYTEQANDKNFLYKALGVVLRKANTKHFIGTQLEFMFTTVKHTSQLEREGCAIGFGYCASTNFETVITKLEQLAKGELQKKSSGIFSFIKDKMDTDTTGMDQSRATAILCYGQVAFYAQPSQLQASMDSSILRSIVPHFNSKEPVVKRSLTQAVELIGNALHPTHMKMSYELANRPNLLGHMMAFCKAESSKSLNTDLKQLSVQACTALLKLDPRLSLTETSDLMDNFMNAIFPLLPDSGKSKEDTEGERESCVDLLAHTTDSLNELLKQILRKSLNSDTLEVIFKHLGQWLSSLQPYERERSMSAACEVLYCYHENKEFGVGNSTTFTNLGRHLGVLVPRVSDPLVSVRQLAIGAIQSLLQIQLLYQGTPRDDEDAMISALSVLKERVARDDPNALFSVVSDLSKVLSKKLPPDQLEPFVKAMLEALLDPHDHSSSGACVVLNSVLKTRGSELYLQVESLVNDLHCKLCEITCVQTRTGTLRCMRTLAYHHLIAVINCLMKYNLPYDQTVRDCWQVLAGDGATAQNVLDRLLESLARAVPFQEKPDPRERDKTKTLRIANNQPLAVLSALAEIFRADNCTATMMQNYARVFVTLLTSIGVMVDVKAPPHQKQEEKKDEKQSGGKTGPRGEDWAWDILAPSRDQVLNPSRISIEALRNFLVCTGGDVIIDGLQRIDGWKKLAVAADIPDVICNVARSLAVQKPELLTQVITAMNPSLASLYDTQRIVAVAFLGELIGHCGKADGALTEIMMNSLMTRLVDPSQSVRMLCIRGLGNVGTAGNEQVQKYSTTVLSAMMAGMDDREDKEGDITLAAMSGLSKILAAIDEHHVRGILINIALRIRPCFEKERDEVRAEAFRLFGNLSRFSDGPSRDPFLEQIHANLVSLLLHLHDSSEDVVKASKYSLRLLGPRISSSSLNDMFQKHLLDDAHLHYGEFINDLSKVLIASYPEKINFYVMGNVSFFKSSCHMIRSNAAMFTGFLLGNLPKEKQMSISKEHVCGAIILLLKDSEPDVRIKAAEAMSLLTTY